VTNPETPDPTPSFLIETYYDNQPFIVDDSTALNLIMTPIAGELKSILVTASSYNTL